jgi:hypothetical protein
MTTVGTKYRGTKHFLLVYARLISAAQKREVVYYEEVARLVSIDQPGHHMAREVGQVLGEISEDETRAGRPMLSAIAIATKGHPGEGFFNLATRLKKYSGSSTADEMAFWRGERDAVYKEWAA